MTERFGIIGIGKSIPTGDVITNDSLRPLVGDDYDIFAKTGILERRYCGPGEGVTSLATKAAEEAIKMAKIRPDQLGLIAVATLRSDLLFPATGALLQDRLDARNAAGFDLSAACAGFVMALSLLETQAHALEEKHNHVLVVGAEEVSRLIDPNNKDTKILFGDAGGAVVVGPVTADYGPWTSVFRSDGSGGSNLYAASDPSCPTDLIGPVIADGNIHMKGRDVYRRAVREMSQSIRDVSRKAGLTKGGKPNWERITRVIPHQANGRIIEAVAHELNAPPGMVFNDIENYGNTSAASIPIALHDAYHNGLLEEGKYVIAVGFGGGYTWGAVAFPWYLAKPREEHTTTRRVLGSIKDLFRPQSAATPNLQTEKIESDTSQ